MLLYTTDHTSPCWGCGNYTAVDLHFANSTHWIGQLGASGHYSTELFAAEAVRVIDSHAAATPDAAKRSWQAPLFLYLAFEAVHGASSCYARGQPPNCEHPDDDELQVPQRYVQAQAHIERQNRRRYAGMVGALDEAVANVTAALRRARMLSSSLLVFTSDNGGASPRPCARSWIASLRGPETLPSAAPNLSACNPCS